MGRTRFDGNGSFVLLNPTFIGYSFNTSYFLPTLKLLTAIFLNPFHQNSPLYNYSLIGQNLNWEFIYAI